MPRDLVLNALVPFSTRYADDGLLHVRGWQGSAGAVILVAEMDWALLVGDRTDAYFGPGLFQYPEYAFAAARSAAHRVGLYEPGILTRMPDPPGERYDRVVDPDDPQGWQLLTIEQVTQLVGAPVHQPPPGSYVPRVVAEWIRTGSAP
ncbi:MAG: hypothetical protein EXQ74_06040 [Thermoleophilia bacterium]|nr:hypothetical protein [Thermoleophilia bacterium]